MLSEQYFSLLLSMGSFRLSLNDISGKGLRWENVSPLLMLKPILFLRLCPLIFELSFCCTQLIGRI